MKKGFTLIELLAVIAVLVIIALIATPLTTGFIRQAKKRSYKTSVDHLLITIKEEQTSGGLNQQVIYYLEDGVISGDLKYDGRLDGNGFVRVDEDGKTAAKVEVNNYCIYKFRDDKKSNIMEGNCGEYGGFLLETLRVDRHSIDIFSSYDERMGRFFIKMEREENGTMNEYTRNDNSRYYYYTDLTPGEDYYFYGKVQNIHDEELTDSLKVVTQNVDMPTITNIQGNVEWEASKDIRIDFFEIEPDCVYQYRINSINETNGTYPGGTWLTTTNSQVNLNINRNNTQIEAQVINAEGHIIREVDYIVRKVDPTVPVMTRVGETCYIKTGTDRDILDRYYAHLDPYELSQGDYTRAGNFGPSGGTNVCTVDGVVATNINQLARHDNYTLSCTATTGTGVSVTQTIQLYVANYQSQYATRVAQCQNCTYDIGCAQINYCNCRWVGSGPARIPSNSNNPRPECRLPDGTKHMCYNGTEVPGCWYGAQAAADYVGCPSAYSTGVSCPLYYETCNEQCDNCGCAVPTTETSRNCLKCGEETWTSWTTTSTSSTDTITCKKRIARLDILGNVVGERLCTNCGNISADTCAGVEEDTCS